MAPAPAPPHAAAAAAPALDPLQILNLPKNFSVEQLKFHYKTLARQLHPDKAGGRRLTHEQANATFQLITQAYKTLLDDVQNRQQSAAWDVLRAQSHAGIDGQGSHGPSDGPSHGPSHRSGGSVKRGGVNKGGVDASELPPPVWAQGGGSGGRFNIARFNTVFSENRMDDPVHDSGYGDWMQEADPAEDRSMERLQLSRFVEPQPLVVTTTGAPTTAFTELGLSKMDDYSRNDGGSCKRSVQYTDYRIAHTTRKLGDESLLADRQAFASVDDLKAMRATISYTPSDQELQRQAEEERARIEEEERRRAACRERDAVIEKQYERIRRGLLTRS